MQETELLRALPKSKRNVPAREDAKSKDLEVVRVAKLYGEMYFDGPRDYGYGGYRYDGRWKPVARDMIEHFNLSAGDRVLDIGCAKGFLVHDLMQECPGLEVFGLDISEYALKHCPPEVIGRLHLGNANSLPFPDASFDAVISLNTLHNFDREGVKTVIGEMERVSRRDGNSFIQVDSYRSPEQRALFMDWVLTADFHDYPDGWVKLFKEAGYKGDYYWTIL
ncbi:MAG: methyltransferase [Coxiella sp. (in: Bacteria)]|nr:MAG: methyltransferase [Coxiella sp. (in: g-proteobacteria)]